MGFLKKFAGTLIGGAIGYYTGGLVGSSLIGLGVGASVGSQVDSARAYSNLADAANRNAAEQRAQAERAFQASKERADIQNVRNIRANIRRTRIAAGAMANLGMQTGGAGGSGLAGGLSSIGSQLAGNISYMGDIAAQENIIGQANLAMSQSQARYSAESASAQSTIGTAGAISNVVGTIFGPTGMQEGVQAISQGWKKYTAG